MRCWMAAAAPFVILRRQPSHGFRESFQAAEVHFAVRALLQKHREQGSSVVVAKLDIRKANDTLSWPSIQSMFERRRLPPALQDAYWRAHRGRRLQFRTSCGTVRFGITPTQGIPQGSPESPLIYATVMEMIIEDTEDALSKNKRPCGVTLDQVFSHSEVEAQKGLEVYDAAKPWINFLSFADDTYVLARHIRMLEYQLTVFRGKLGQAGQHLHLGKCEVLGEEPQHGQTRPSPRVWSEREMTEFVCFGRWPEGVPPDAPLDRVKPVASMTILGSVVTATRAQEAALPARTRVAWMKCIQLRGQLRSRTTSAASRVRLLDAVMVPTVMWGLRIEGGWPRSRGR